MIVVRLIGAVIAILMMLIMSPFIRWRAHRRYRQLAHRLGAGKGQILRRDFQGGAMVTPRLEIISLRTGTWQAVLQEVAGDAYAQGYRDTAPAPESPPRGRYYRPPRGQNLPPLIVSVYAPGEVIERLNRTVPAAQTGVQLVLG